MTGSPARWRPSASPLERLELRGDETVLDVGCGLGRITQALIERVPDGYVIAVDASLTCASHSSTMFLPSSVSPSSSTTYG